MIREVRLTTNKHTRYGALQVIIHPKPSHCVVHRRENHHWRTVWIGSCNTVIHVEQIAVAFFNCFATIALNRIAEVEKHAQSRGRDTATFITRFFRRTRGNVAWRKISKAGVLALQEVITVILSHRIRVEFTFANLLSHVFTHGRPNTTIVA